MSKRLGNKQLQNSQYHMRLFIKYSNAVCINLVHREILHDEIFTEKFLMMRYHLSVYCACKLMYNLEKYVSVPLPGLYHEPPRQSYTE